MTQEEFTPLNDDSMIKHILGNEKNIKFTKNFIHNVTNIPYKKLEGATITNSEKLNKDNIKNKSFEPDMIMRLKDGMKIMIDMQNDNSLESELKNLCYGLRELINQIKIGEKYETMKPVYQIIIVKNDYIKRKIKKKLLNEFQIIEKENNKLILLDGLYTIKIVDLKCEIEYGKYSEELIGWKNLLKAESLEEAKIAGKGIKILEEVLKEMIRFMDEVKPRMAFEKFEEDKRLQRELGIKEGINQGETNKTYEFAKEMLISGEDDNKIKKYTKLSFKEILKLKKQLNIL